MRVLLTSPTFFPRKFGGITLFSYELARNLEEKGHDVTVYTTDVNDKSTRLPNDHKMTDVNGIKVRYFKNLSNLLAYNNFYLPVDMWPEVRRDIANFDLVHMCDFRNFLSVVVHHYAQKEGIPYLLEANGGLQPVVQKQNMKRAFDSIFGNNILKDASRLIAGCDVETTEYVMAGIDRAKIRKVPPLYNVREFSNLPPKGLFKAKFGIREDNIILFLGRMHKIKGIDFLIEAFQKLCKERDDVILVLVGPDQGYKPILESLIRKYNIQCRVLFTGTLRGQDKLSALVDATMLVQTSIYERGPGSPFEAVLCNTPIIVTKNTGAGEIVGRTDAGYLVEYGDIKELVNLMKRIIADPQEANQKARVARQYIINNLSWCEGVKQYECVYNEIMNYNEAA